MKKIKSSRAGDEYVGIVRKKKCIDIKVIDFH